MRAGRRWHTHALLAVVTAAAALVAMPATRPAVATAFDVEEWPVPMATATPRLLVDGPDGALWATSTGNDYVYRFDTRDGALLSSYHIDGAHHSVRAHLAKGGDGNMWLTAPRPTASNANTSTANAIIRLTPGGTQTEFPLSPAGAAAVGPNTIVAGPPSDPDAMWFGESVGGRHLGRISLDGTSITHHVIPAMPGPHFEMTAGPDASQQPGASLWFATWGGAPDEVIRVSVSPTAAPVVTLRVPLPAGWHAFSMTGGPVDPVTGLQHDVWLTDDVGDRVGRIAYDGTFTSWSVSHLADPNPPNGGSQGTYLRTPTGIMVGPDNGIWVAIKAINSVAQFDPATGTFTLHRGRSAIVRPVGLATGSDGNVWYSALDPFKMGRVVVDPVTPPAAAASAFTLSGEFEYHYPGSAGNIVQKGFPAGIARSGGSLEVAMSESDRIQRVPVTLSGGPPSAAGEVQVATGGTTASTHPWRTLRPQANGMPRKLVTGAAPFGDTWVTMNADTVWQVTTLGGAVGEQATPRYPLTGLAACCFTQADTIYLSGPDGIAAAPSGVVWFTEYTSGKIARADTGAIQEESTPTADSGPLDIVATAGGHVWFTEHKAGKIGHRLPSGAFTEVSVGDKPHGITIGPDGAVWFTLEGDNAVGRLDAAGGVRTWTLPTPAAGPTAITLGPDGGLYVAEYLGGKVARLEVDAAWNPTWKEWTLPYGELSRPYWLAAGPDGKIWVTLPYRNRVASLDPTATPD